MIINWTIGDTNQDVQQGTGILNWSALPSTVVIAPPYSCVEATVYIQLLQVSSMFIASEIVSSMFIASEVVNRNSRL